MPESKLTLPPDAAARLRMLETESENSKDVEKSEKSSGPKKSC